MGMYRLRKCCQYCKRRGKYGICFLIQLISHPFESIQKYYLSLFDYSKLLKATREFKLRKTIAPIIEMNSSRNTVAHSLNPLDSDAVKQLGIAMKTLKTLVREQYHFSQSDFNFYQDLNKKLLTKLN